MSDLTVGTVYTIIQVERITTKYGPALVAELESEDDESFKVFLPKRFAGRIEDDQLPDLAGMEMEYRGGKFHEVEFL